MIDQILLWYRARSEREQLLVAIAAVLAVVTLIWTASVLLLAATASADARYADAVRRLADTEAKVEAVRALSREGDRRGAADAAVAARDQRLAAKEAPRAAVGFLAVIGTGRHLAGESGPRLRLFFERRLGIEFARIAKLRRRRGLI